MELAIWDYTNDLESWPLAGQQVPYSVSNQTILSYRGGVYSDALPLNTEIVFHSKYYDEGLKTLYYDAIMNGITTGPPLDYSTLRPIGGAVGDVFQISAEDTVRGQGIQLSFSVDYANINPRIVGFNVYCKRTLEGFVEEADYKKIEYWEINTTSSQWSRINDRAVHNLNYQKRASEKALSYWKVDYSTDGKGYRPYEHTEEDISRKMGLIKHRRDRMYSGLLDGDQGQELIGYTPISNGYGQLDVWFKPKILVRGNGQAYTALLEQNDFLYWFQKNNLVVGTMGDSNRMVDYQFHATGGGIGTELVLTICKSDRSIFFANYEGIYRLQGQTNDNIALGSWLEDWQKIPQEEKANCIGAYNPKKDEYWLFVPGSSTYDITGAATVARKPQIWIWDDNEINGNTWRTYTLDHYPQALENYHFQGFTTRTPIYFFADEDNNWIFVDSANFSYFWRVNDVALDSNRINTQPVPPISLEVETQNLGERVMDIIPEAIQLTREPVVRTDTTVTLYRNEASLDNYSSADVTKQQEQLTIKKEFIHLPRLFRRRRSSQLRIRIAFEDILADLFSGTSDNTWKRPEIREILLKIISDRKRAR
jgi:hypothetical protein